MILYHQIRTIPLEIKGNIRGILLALLLISSFVTLQAQQGIISGEKKDAFYQRYRLEEAKNRRQALRSSSPFSSLAFTLPDYAAYEDLFCVVGADTFKVVPSAHQPEGMEGIVSELLVFEEHQSTLVVLGEPEEEVLVHLMYAPVLPEKREGSRLRQLVDPCEQPEVVSQAVWRTGLPEPQYRRDFNEVSHLIVHHSATGNSTGNYAELVRNIYLYHTRVNGWSDIGYNYLIAPDGTLYAGRDPGEGEQDNVKGAHFCGQNNQTMGVCLLGDFSEKEPALPALQRLEHLLAWKSEKEGLDPLAVSLHPAGTALPVIAGHRAGCATLCPGEELYQRLPELRLAVAERLEDCGETEEVVWVYFAPKQQEVCLGGVAAKELLKIELFNMEGKEVGGALLKLDSRDYCFKINGLSPGIYFLQTERKGALIRKKFMIF